MQKFTITEPFLDSKCGLSEGPFYEEATNTLRFIDIVKKHVWWVDLNKGASSAKKIEYDISFGVTANLASSTDSFLFGGKHGIGIAKRDSNRQQYETIMRANDGAIDSQGRFWVGAMNDPAYTNGKFDPVGILFRLDTDGTLHRVLENVTIPNGISFSLDNKTMYWTDTPTGNIYAFDYDVSTGNISNQRVFWHSDLGGPDGHAMDVEGNLWVALWGGWKVVRVSPEGCCICWRGCLHYE
uniref:SMP-30/Gluconolactonase/LRE-like region domain-containing protein n=1 Tax=Talaromyces marneffei PM1 TaxID=1077442 RepID=A0A093VI65_TALMA